MESQYVNKEKDHDVWGTAGRISGAERHDTACRPATWHGHLPHHAPGVVARDLSSWPGSFLARASHAKPVMFRVLSG